MLHSIINTMRLVGVFKAVIIFSSSSNMFAIHKFYLNIIIFLVVVVYADFSILEDSSFLRPPDPTPDTKTQLSYIYNIPCQKQRR